MPNFFDKYPYTDFHELNLDWIIKTVKEVVAEWAVTLTEWHNTQEEWQQLYNYVHDYFDNLDLTQEVSDKIDEMVTSGALAACLAPYLGYVTPQMYGAVGDGITDDSASITSAIQSGYSVLFISGYYSSVSIRLPSRTILKGNTNTCYIKFGTNAGFIIDGRQITVEDLIINGPGDSTGYGFADIDNALTTHLLNIRNVNITDFKYGILLGAITWDCTFDNIRIDRCDIGVSTSSGSAGMVTTFTNLYISHCARDLVLDACKFTFIGCNFGFDHTYAFSIGNVSAIKFQGCNFESDIHSDDAGPLFDLSGRVIDFDQCLFKPNLGASSYMFSVYSGLEMMSFKGCHYSPHADNLMPNNNVFSAGQANTRNYGAISFDGGNSSFPRPNYNSAQTPNWVDREKGKTIGFYGTTIDTTKLEAGAYLYQLSSNKPCVFNGTNIVSLIDGTIIV